MSRCLLIVLLLAYGMGSMAQPHEVINLPQAKFTTGNEAGWASFSFNDSLWKTVSTGTVWQQQGFDDYHGYAWYRIHVIISSNLKQQAHWKDSVRIYLAHVNDADETFLNGVLIGKTGAFPADSGGYQSKWPAERNYALAANNPVIRWNEENVIAIKVYDGGGTGGIFMGNPFIDMLEKTDGLTIHSAPADIHFNGSSARLQLSVVNRFNTTVNGIFSVTVNDNETGRQVLAKQYQLSLKPFDQREFPFTVPNKPGINLSYKFTESFTGLNIHKVVTVPYILTPAVGDKPLINSAAVYGTHPGAPFIFKIAATGKKPLTYHAENLPDGLRLDAKNGLLSGTLANAGNYKIQLKVANSIGSAAQTLTVKAGELLSLTPPMGWNSWNCWGTNVSEEKIKQAGEAFIKLGLVDYGWSYINIDDGWQNPLRNEDGSIRPNEKFTSMKVLGDWLHNRGLQFGIYSSPGPKTCGGYTGSYQHELQDAASYASWGIDYLKYDWCSYDGVVEDTSLAAYIKPFALMDSAMHLHKRNIVYNLCQYGMKDVWKWGKVVNAQSWRTTEDIEDTWQSMRSIGFSQFALHNYAGPGHWNDPDMMLVGQVGWGENLHPSRLTPDEQYTHVTLWSLLSAPLLIGCDLARADAFTISLLTNREVIAINQDIAGKQARRVIANDSLQVWVKELAGGKKALGVFNTSANWRPVKFSAIETGLKPGAIMRDAWRQKNIGVVANNNSVKLPPHGSVLLTIKEK